MGDAKTTFLVVYEYGARGVWSLVDARSKDEIRAKYPKLNVVDDRPNWMTDPEYDRIGSVLHTDIDDEPSGWWQRMTANDKAS